VTLVARGWQKKLVVWDPRVSGNNEPARVGEGEFGPRRGEIRPKRGFSVFFFFISILFYFFSISKFKDSN
jgi:hypothetical protein